MSTGNDRAGAFRDILILASLALLVLLPAVFLRPPARQQELRVLISARNMVRSGDWLRPEFQNQPRFRKPPLPYWMSALALRAAPQNSSAALGRLPFVATSLGALYLLYALSGSRVPPLLCVASFGFWRFAPLAETDMINAFGLLLAMAGFQRKTGALSALGMSLSILSKGPAGLAIPVLTFLILHRRDPRSPAWWALTLIPPLAAGGAWLGFLYSDPIARMALQAEIRDTFLDSPNRRGPLFYLYTLPAMLGPAFFLALPRKGLQPRLTLPWVWFGVTFLLLTLTPSKQNHYVLMLLPPAAWILSPLALRKPLIPLVFGIALAGAAAEFRRSETHPDALHSRFLSEIRPMTEGAPEIHVVGINSARFDFHLGRHVQNLDSARRALQQASPGDAVIIIQPRDRFDAEAVSTPHDAGDAGWNRLFIRRP